MTPNKLLLIFLLFAFSAPVSRAQEGGNWELGIMAGGAGYMGDLNQNNPVKISGFSAGVFGKRNFNQYIGVRLNYTYGQVEANDAESSNQQFRDRNLRFKTSLSELSAIADFNLFNFKLGGGNRYFTPYIFAGAGAVIFKPTIKYEGEKYRLDRKATEGQENPYNNVALTIPYGVGLKYNYKDTWSVFSEIGYRTPMTDYIDDVSGKYPDRNKDVKVGNPPLNLTNPADLNNPNYPNIGVPGTQRGDFRKRDTYLFVSVGISFTFVSSKCYSF
jgi:opacity protein-like surface antigen